MTHLKRGFTLIELSIVLVIIGLIVGGILTGQTLIAAAGVRAQIAQIEKYNTAANTFYTKYGYLPGDIPAAPAAQFGFASRGTHAGEGDGDGEICGVYQDADNSLGDGGTTGETAMFWVDLSTAHLIDGGFSMASSTQPYVYSYTGPTMVAPFMPAAKIGGNSFIFVWCADAYDATPLWVPAGKNFFDLSGVVNIGEGQNFTTTTLTPNQAYAIDSKIDDGFPQSGTVVALVINTEIGAEAWAAGGGGTNQGASTGYPNDNPTTASTAPSATTCYDNRSTAGQKQQYSLTYNGGNNPNCGLSFKMQAGD
jgi:prepilin-type N-terminal cleavage/methylation domain-containing protein